MADHVNTSCLNDEDRREFRTVTAILWFFKAAYPEMTIKQALTLCWVASNEGGTQRELCTTLGLSTSGTSAPRVSTSSHGGTR